MRNHNMIVRNIRMLEPRLQPLAESSHFIRAPLHANRLFLDGHPSNRENALRAQLDFLKGHATLGPTMMRPAIL